MDSNATPAEQTNLSEIKRKMHFEGTVVKTSLAGAIVDIGQGVPGVVHISRLSTEPVKRVEDVVQVGQKVDVWVLAVFPKKNRIDLTMMKPLELEWNEIKPEMVTKGKVTRLEKFGVFVDIGAERPGLVHISEMTHDYIRTPGDMVKEGDEVEVKVLDVDKKKRQIKLSIKALMDKPEDVVKEVLSKAPAKPSRERGKEKDKEAAAEEEAEAPVPTAMEMALREAMDRKNVGSPAPASKKRRKGGESSDELEGILSRTLKSRSN
jgi:ribosomal protein S1